MLYRWINGRQWGEIHMLNLSENFHKMTFLWHMTQV